MKKSVIWKVSDEDFIKFVKESFFYKEVLRKCGLEHSGNYTTLKKRIALLNLSTIHFKKANAGARLRPGKPLKDICVENSTYQTRNLKARLFKELKWEHRCSYCKKTECKWEMTNEIAPIPLELDHINGNNSDHRLENLRLLCPLCHATTKNYKGRNKKCVPKIQNTCIDCSCNIFKTSTRCVPCSSKHNAKTAKRKVPNRPSLEQLEEDLKNLPCTKVGKKYGVCDNTIRKWISNYKKQ